MSQRETRLLVPLDSPLPTRPLSLSPNPSHLIPRSSSLSPLPKKPIVISVIELKENNSHLHVVFSQQKYNNNDYHLRLITSLSALKPWICAAL